jgi:hypothetical protein
MKKNCWLTFLGALLLSFASFGAKAQTSPKPMETLPVANQWSDGQLLEPSVLAAEIKAGDAPVIFNIGAVEDIKGAKHIGPVGKAENLEKFKSALTSLPNSTTIVIYCGCCPFSKCPNIRPAFIELKKLGFTNIKLLNLSTNLKTNWISMGYPLAQE